MAVSLITFSLLMVCLKGWFIALWPKLLSTFAHFVIFKLIFTDKFKLFKSFLLAIKLWITIKAMLFARMN